MQICPGTDNLYDWAILQNYATIISEILQVTRGFIIIISW